MPKKPNYLEHLEKVPLFSACSKKELQHLNQLCDETTIKAGKEIVRQGSVGYECFVIFEGEAKVERNGHFITTIGPGKSFGELSLLDKGPRTATVTALTDMTVFVIGPREFDSALDTIPGLGKKVMTSLARMVRDMDVRLAG